MFGFVFCLILLFSVEIKHYKSLGYVFLFSFLNFLPQYTHWVLLRLRSHAFCHSEPVLFFSPPLSSLTPYLLSWVVVLGHGGAVADFSMRGLSNLYSDSKKRIRTSYQSKSFSSEKAIGATQQQGGNPQTMGCHLSKCVILMMFTKGRITITYCITLNTALFIVIQFIVTEYHIFWICIHRNIQLQPLIVSLLSVF